MKKRKREDLKASKWACSSCTFENDSSLYECEICENLREIPKEEIPSKSKAKVAERRKDVIKYLDWNHKYCPTDVKDLCVHNKKIEKLKEWIKNENRGKLLILYGPPGIGKSITLNVLLKEMKISSISWTDRVVGDSHYNANSGTQHVSQIEDFSRFIKRAQAYNPLSLSSSAPPPSPSPLASTSSSSMSTLSNLKNIIIFEDLPHINSTFNYSNQDGKSFENLSKLQGMLFSFVNRSINPGILVISGLPNDESLHETSLKRLLSENVYSHSNVSLLEFNPVTDLSVFKAMKRVVDLAGVKISDSIVESIAKNSFGDVRNAINNLQFTCNSFSRKKDMGDSEREFLTMSGGEKNSYNNMFSGIGPPKGFTVPSDWEICTKETAKGGSLKMYIAPDKKKKCRSIPEVWRYLASLEEEKNKGDAEEGREEDGKNRFLDDMHLVGKLLNGRKNADTLMELSHFDNSTLALFVQENMANYFTDIHELSSACDILSDTMIIESSKWIGGQTSTSLVDQISSSLISRAVIVNEHPSISSFRPIRKPTYLTVQNLLKNKKGILFTLENSFSVSYNNLSFIFDTIPMMKYIIKENEKIELINEITNFSGWEKGVNKNVGFTQKNIEEKKNKEKSEERVNKQLLLLKQDDIEDV